MKKAGIITIHMINNYGAVGQAYALNRYLNEHGVKTETIDFRTYRVKESYQIFRKICSVMDIVRNMQAFMYYGKLKCRNMRFYDFLKKNVPMTQQIYYTDQELLRAKFDYDYYICGSDQIWNTYCKNYNDAFILKFATQGKRISYAASMGAADINENVRDKFRTELRKYEAISVREANAVDIISEISGKEVQHVVDPVFLLEADQWRTVSTGELIDKPYIFFYSVHGDVPGMRDFVRKLGDKKNLPIVVVNLNLREMKYKNIKCYDAGPAEFISLIDHAEYVCTNSFHACAFSIIFKKQFLVFTDTSGGKGATSSRICSLLSSFGLTERVGNQGCAIEKIVKEIDYYEVYNKLIPMINDSKKFLSDALRLDEG